MRQLELQLQISASIRDSEWLDRESMGQSREDISLNSGQEVLTPRRREVLARYLGGETREEIAGVLGVSPNTIRNHIRLVYEEIGLTNRVEALRWALGQPSLAHYLLSNHGESDRSDPLRQVQGTSEKPATVEQMLDEAITFFQQAITESPLGST